LDEQCRERQSDQNADDEPGQDLQAGDADMAEQDVPVGHDLDADLIG